MSEEDWYRNKEWNHRIESAFLAKLSRARSQRDQYLAIQALTIAPHQPHVALRLTDLYFDTRKSDFDDVRALLARAKAYRYLNDMSEAAKAYKAVLSQESKFPNHKTRTYVELPYLIASRELSTEYAFALTVLAQGLGSVAVPIDRFMWHASRALISSAQGDDPDAQEHAREALDAAQVKKSGFRYHQNTGLVGNEHQAVIKRLVKLAAGGLALSYVELPHAELTNAISYPSGSRTKNSRPYISWRTSLTGTPLALSSAWDASASATSR